MKRYILKKKLFTIIFLFSVLGFAGLNAYHLYYPLKYELNEIYEENGKVEISDIETEIVDNMYQKMSFVESYAFTRVLLDKKESNNFAMIKDEKGFLHYASFYKDADPDIMEYARRVKKLKDYANARGTEVLFVVAPSKYNSKYVKFRTGMPVNNPEDIVNELMFDLNRLGIETLNLGEYMPNQELSYEQTFFKTDHHWTVPAAFYAAKMVTDRLEKSFGAQFLDKEYYLDENNYEQVTYKSGMLGSMGRKTGAVFSGIDDFTAFWPKFDGDFDRESMLNDGRMEYDSGTFLEAFMEPTIITEPGDAYSTSQYALYLNELRIYEKIVNNNNPDGPNIFMIRDSYFSPVIAFMMPMCGEIDAMWSLEKSDKLDIQDYIENNQFDYIVIEVYPYNINNEAFNYFKEEING